MEKLIIFLKAPRPGLVKTRLAQALGDKRALAAYRKLVETLVSNLRRVPSVELCFSPDDAEAEIRQWLQPGWTATPQGEGDLGARLTNAFTRAFASGAKKIAIIGSDCPYVSPEDIQVAWKALDNSGLVIGPATDGGYWLIGLSRNEPRLFENIPWSSDNVLATTLQRAKSLGLKIELHRLLPDIDTAEDWKLFEESPGAFA